jgi:hypothetical protein
MKLLGVCDETATLQSILAVDLFSIVFFPSSLSNGSRLLSGISE